MDSAATRLSRIHTLQSEVTSSPWSHDLIELGMAVSVSLADGGSGPVLWLVAVGPPGCGKTQTSAALRKAKNGYPVDNVSENWIASGYRDPTSGKQAPNTLEGMDGKCVIFKELSTVFSLRHEKVQRFIGDLQALYDGEYVKLTGTVGQTGGKARFSIFGCITPDALEQHRTYMARIGSRFLFYRVPTLTRAERAAGLALVRRQREERTEAERALNNTVAQHIDAILADSVVPIVCTPEQDAALDSLAELLAAGRGVVRDEDGDGYTQIEEPFRAAQQLRTLVTSLARVHGRRHLTGHEIELARRVVLSSIPPGRSRLLVYLATDGPATAKQCAEAIEKSNDQATRQLNDLARLELVTCPRSRESTGGRPPTMFAVTPRFVDFLAPWSVLDHNADIEAAEPDAA